MAPLGLVRPSGYNRSEQSFGVRQTWLYYFLALDHQGFLCEPQFASLRIGDKNKTYLTELLQKSTKMVPAKCLIHSLER